MTTAVVVTTVVTTNASENEFKTHALEQIRDNDRSLLDRLTAKGIEAKVVTAIMDVVEFMEYVRERREKTSTRQANGHAANGHAATQEHEAGEGRTTAVTENMTEAEFMDFALQQLRAGEQKPLVSFSEADIEALEDEQMGEHFSRYPFQY
jgi:hypothetical protein